jgi:homoserine dehydrogenase
VFARDPEIVVEALPGVEPARRCITHALLTDIRVVTANKALIAADWDYISPDLAGPDRLIRYAAAVGGAVPMIEALERLRRIAPIVSLRGVVNGTCNYVLDQCAGGASFAHAVRRAQELGFAESDPAADLGGLDAARKMGILGRLAFGGTPLCDVVSGISEGACLPREEGTQRRLALVGEAHRAERGFSYAVAARELAADDFLAGARGAENRLEIALEDCTTVRLHGLGAGRVPTATALFADLLEHAWVIEAESVERKAARRARAQLCTDEAVGDAVNLYPANGGCWR